MGLSCNRDSNKSWIYGTHVREPVLLNRRDFFGNGTQPPELIDRVGCKYGCVVHLLLTNTDPAQLVTNDPDILFCGLHTGRVLLPG